MTPSKRIWNLWDMLKFNADFFVFSTKALGVYRGLASQTGITSNTLATMFDPIASALNQTRDSCANAGLRMTTLCIEQQLRHLEGFKKIPQNTAIAQEIAHGLEEVQNRLQDELSLQFLLSLTPKEAEWFSINAPRFGGGVEDKFPALVEDIDESAKCLGLGRYTASVFHLMRVMERGVQTFGQKLGITAVNILGQEKNWQNILDEINKSVKSLPQIDSLTKRYANISSNLYNVKLAWRNEVMHPKATYTPDEAEAIFLAVRGFMRELASVI